MFIHTRGSAPKRSAKFGRQKGTVVGKKRKKLFAIPALHLRTVKTFNSCTSRLDVCQCLVVQPWITFKNKLSTSMTHVANANQSCVQL